MVFCFIQKKISGQHESYNIYFFCRTKCEFFSPEFNIRLYDKNSETDFFSLHQNQIIFFSNIGNICLEKNHNPPWKLNGPSLISCWKDKQSISVLWLDWFEPRLKLDKKKHLLSSLSVHALFASDASSGSPALNFKNEV